MDKLMASGRVSYSRFSNWIKKNPTSTTHALCKLCNNKYMDVSRMGTSALVSHANGTRHKQKVSAVNPLALFFKANEQTASKTTPSVPPSSTSTCNETVPETNNDASSSTKTKIISSNDASDVLDVLETY